MASRYLLSVFVLAGEPRIQYQTRACMVNPDKLTSLDSRSLSMLCLTHLRCPRPCVFAAVTASRPLTLRSARRQRPLPLP